MRIFGCVVEQIAEHLREPRRVGVDRQRLLGQREPQLDSVRLDKFPRHFGGVTDRRSQIGQLFFQVDLAAADPRHIHEIVDKPNQMVDLSLHHLLNMLGGLARLVHFAQHISPLRSGASGLRSSCASVAMNSSLRRSASRSCFFEFFRSAISLAITAIALAPPATIGDRANATSTSLPFFATQCEVVAHNLSLQHTLYRSLTCCRCSG